jgi:hypothetical protein
MISEDTYVFLRVFSDGTAEYQLSKFSNAENNKVPPIRKAMTQSEFIKIESSVNDPKLTKVGPRYGVNFALDTSTEWIIKIRRPRAPQITHILEFAPSLAKTMKGPYPDALLRLGCNVLGLRAQLSGEPVSLDNQCKGVLDSSK